MSKLLRFLLIFLFLPAVVVAQKNFTLRQVTTDTVTLRPKKLDQLQWIPGTDDFAYVFSNNNSESLYKENSEIEGKEEFISLDHFNAVIISAGLDTIKSFPQFTWTSSNTIRFWNENKFVEYNLNTNMPKIVNNIKENGKNADFITPDKIAYTLENNLYIAVNSKQIQVTNDKDKGIVNGQVVHRKEFNIKKGTFWSPKGNYLAFYRKDETMVTDYPILDISKRPAIVNYIKYPMAGMTSEEVTIGVYNLRTKKITWLKTGEPKDHYLPGVTWSPDEKYIYVNELNRDQNDMKLSRYNATTGELTNVLFEETSDKYVEPMHGPIFFEGDPSMFIWISRVKGWNHLFLYDAQGAKIVELTKGDWEVTEYDGLSLVGYNIFFTATKQSPIERQYYKVDLDRYEMIQITNDPGVHDAVRNESGTKFLDQVSNLETPYEVKVIDKTGQTIRQVYSTPNPFDGYNTCKIEIDTLKGADGYNLYCRTIYPSDFDQSKKYPVIVYLYGGPHDQLVLNKWIGNAKTWLYYLAQQGFIIFTLDNRGSNNRGLEFEQKTFRNLGTIEIVDQMIGVNYLKSLSYVDTTRIGVYGRSYGGFMSAGLMLKNPGVFKVCVSESPVIDWKYYEVMYTERYMDTPEMNPDGYTESSLLNYIQDLKGKLLLVHGTSDPVVVWQHTLLFVEKSTHLGIDIDYFPYIDHKHHIKGVDQIHLYQKISNYFLDNL